MSAPLTAHVWQRFSRKVHQRLSALHSCGTFEEATRRGQELIVADARNARAHLRLFWLVDPLDGIVVDSRYQALGPTALIAAAEGACEWIVGKRYDRVGEITADHIDVQLRDAKGSLPAFPPECGGFLNLAVDATLAACQLCALSIDLPDSKFEESDPLRRRSPLLGAGDFPLGMGGGTRVDNWLELAKERQLTLIESALNERVRPLIALDEGGLSIVDLIEGKELIISYQGACVGCHSATGATLGSIQAILRAHLFEDLIVTPKL